MADELLPCPNPWCTSTTKPLPVSLKRDGWRVTCACSVATFREPTEAEAIAAWNRRALDAAPAETADERQAAIVAWLRGRAARTRQTRLRWILLWLAREIESGEWRRA